MKRARHYRARANLLNDSNCSFAKLFRRAAESADPVARLPLINDARRIVTVMITYSQCYPISSLNLNSAFLFPHFQTYYDTPHRFKLYCCHILCVPLFRRAKRDAGPERDT